MRKLASIAFALLLLALMPAFALLRYEHSLRIASDRSADPAGRSATTGRSDAPTSRGPSRSGSGAHAAAPDLFFTRALALAALDEVADSLPRPPGAPPARWRVVSEKESIDLGGPIAFTDVSVGCVDLARSEPCRGPDEVTLIAFQLLSQDIELATLQADWKVGRLRGTFYILMRREDDAWHPIAIARAGRGGTERQGS